MNKRILFPRKIGSTGIEIIKNKIKVFKKKIQKK